MNGFRTLVKRDKLDAAASSGFADTTLLMILLACAGVPGCGVATWLMGYIGDHSGLGAALYLVPACYLILSLLIGCDAYTHK